jgi:hypothetical protein
VAAPGGRYRISPRATEGKETILVEDNLAPVKLGSVVELTFSLPSTEHFAGAQSKLPCGITRDGATLRAAYVYFLHRSAAALDSESPRLPKQGLLFPFSL